MAENERSAGLTLMARAGRAVSRWSIGTAVAAGLTPVASAGPTGGTVVVGDVTFTQSGEGMTITASDGSVIHFDSFNLSASEWVNFIQPGSDARVFNRILSGLPSQIDGSIFANGVVYFVNPAGIVFGPSSVINVGAMYAAAATLSEADFLSGHDLFTDASGAVINQGQITASRIHLLGNQIQNHGSLRADGGLVVLAAGDNFLISPDDSGVMVRVDGRSAALGPSAGHTTPGRGAQAGVLNTGWIDAGSGSAVLASGDLYALGIHNLGTVSASGGDVLVSAQDGLVFNEGTLDVSALVQAGSLIVRGPSVLNTGSVLADSSTGQAGYAEVTSQNHTLLLGGSLVSASGGSGTGTGGEILIHSYQGLSILADGAALDISGGHRGGDGGFMEFSGRDMILRGDLRLGASDGFAAGGLLIDPFDLTVVDAFSGGADTDLSDADFTNGLLAGDVGSIGDLETNEILASTLLALGDATITLEAINDLTVDADLDFSGTTTTTLELLAGNDLTVNSVVSGLSTLRLLANATVTGGTDDALGDLVWAPAALATITDIENLELGGANVTLGNLQFGNTANAFDFAGTFAVNGALIDLGTGINAVSAEGLTLGGTLLAGGFGEFVLDAKGGELAFTTLSTNANTLVLRGDSIIGAGLLEATVGSVRLETGGTIGALATAANAEIQQGLTVTNAASVGGNLDATGAVVIGDTLQTGGSLLITGDATLGGDVFAGTSLQITGGAILTGGAAQRLESGGAMTLAGLTQKNTGDLSLESGLNGAGDLTLGGVAVLDGGLVLRSAANVAGDLTGSQGLQLDGLLTLTGAGLQQLDAGTGTLDLNASASKAAGDVTLQGGTINLNTDLTLTSGRLSTSGGDFLTADGVTVSALDIRVRQNGGVSIGLGSTLAATSATAGDGVELAANLDGVGDENLELGNNSILRGQAIELIAGDLNQQNTTSIIMVGSDVVLSDVGGLTGPLTLALRQDAAFDTATLGLTTANLAGGGGLTGLELQSFGSSITFQDAGWVLAQNLDLTLTAQTTIDLISANASESVRSLSTTSVAGLTTVGTGLVATNDITMSGNGVAVQADELRAGNAVTFNAQADFGLGVDQAVVADSIAFNSGAQKSGDGTLRLAGDGIATQVTLRGGDLSVLNGNLDLVGGLEVFADDGQTRRVQASNGLLDISGNVLLAQDTQDNTSVNAGDLVLTSLGNLSVGGTITSTDAALSGADVTLETAAGMLTLADDVTLDGRLIVNGDLLLTKDDALQTLAATRGMDFNGELERVDDLDGILGEDLRLSAGSSAPGNEIAADINLAGNLRGVRNTTITGSDGSTLILDRNGLAQSVDSISGTLTLDLAIVKASGNLRLEAESLAGTTPSISVGDLLINGSGGLTLGSINGTTLADAAITAADSVLFENLGVTSAASVGSVRSQFGSINAQGNLTSAGVVQSALDLFVTGDLNARGDVDSGLGDVTVTGNTTLGGDLNGTTVNLTGNVLLDGAGNQQIVAANTLGIGDGVTLGSVNKQTAGNVSLSGTNGLSVGGVVTTGNGSATLAGAQVELFGNVTVGGDAGDTLTLNGDTVLRDNVSSLASSGGVDVNGSLTLNNANVTISSGNGGTLALQGVTDFGSGTTLNLNTAGDTLLAGDVTVGQLFTDTGGTTRIGDGAAVAIQTQGDQRYGDNVQLGANASLISQAGLEFNGGLGGNFALTTDSVADTVLRAAANGLGSWVASGSSRVVLQADVTTAGDQTYNTLVVVDRGGAATQTTLSGQNITLNQGLAAQDAGLLRYAVRIDASQNATLLGGVTALALDVEAGNSALLDGENLGVSYNATDGISITAGNATLGNADFTTDGVLAINSSGSTQLTNGTFTASRIETDAVPQGGNGSLRLTAAALNTSNGFVFREGTVDIFGNVQLNNSGTAALTLGNNFAGDLLFGGDLAIQTGGDLTIDGATYSGLDNLLLTAPGAISVANSSFLDNLSATIATQRLESGITVSDSIFNRNGAVTIASGGTLSAPGLTPGDITVNGGEFADLGALALLSGGNLRLNTTLGRFDGLNPLTVGDLVLQAGDLNAGQSLLTQEQQQNPGVIIFGDPDVAGTFEILANSVQIQTAAIDPITGMLVPAGDAGRSGVPQVATVAHNGDLSIRTFGGDFSMGRGEKLTVVGDLLLDLGGGNAGLSDITTLGVMAIRNVGNLTILARNNGGVLVVSTLPNTIAAESVLADTGVDFVAGEGFDWDTPLSFKIDQGGANNGIVRFGTAAFDSPTNQSIIDLGFQVQNIGDSINPASLIGIDFNTNQALFFADLRSEGAGNQEVTPALAGAIPRDTEVQEIPASTPVSTDERALMRRLSINAVLPDSREYLASANIGVSLYDDNGTRFNEVTVKRLDSEGLRGMAAEITALMGALSDAERSDRSGELVDTRRLQIRQNLNQAWDGYSRQIGPDGPSMESFHRYMVENGYRDTIEFMGQLNGLLRRVANIGLTSREFNAARDKTVQSISPDNNLIDVEQLIELSTEMLSAESETVAPVEIGEAETVAALD